MYQKLLISIFTCISLLLQQIIEMNFTVYYWKLFMFTNLYPLSHNIKITLESLSLSRQLQIAFILETLSINLTSTDQNSFLPHKRAHTWTSTTFQSSLEFVMFMNFNTLNCLSETNLYSHSKYCFKIWSPLFQTHKRCAAFINFNIMTSNWTCEGTGKFKIMKKQNWCF